MGSTGLYNALERSGELYYAYNTTPNQQIFDIEKLNEKPIFFVRGMLMSRLPIVARTARQFKACWQSESYFTRRGDLDVSTSLLLQNQEHFQMLFVCSESDMGMYKIPTYLLPSWADTTVFDDMCRAEKDGLGFIGNSEGREDFLNGDTKGILRRMNSPLYLRPERTTQVYAENISKFRMLVSPPGRCFVGMCGRAFEIMACRRLCFQWLNEETMFEHMKFFKDGEDIVYFHNWDELNERYEYYSTHLNEADKIATSGYDKVRKFHNQDVRVRYIIECMETEYVKWKQEQDKIPDDSFIFEDIKFGNKNKKEIYEIQFDDADTGTDKVTE